MTDLYDQIILGVGRYGLSKKKYKVDKLIGRVIFLCYFLYVFEKTKLYNPLGSAFKSRIKRKGERK